MKVASIIGARPQFIKAAMVSAALRNAGIHELLLHTGQHYDFQMSGLFFQQLGLPQPDHNLGIGSGTHGAQTAGMLQAIEATLRQYPLDAVLVYGDTNSTLAGALAAAKMHIPVAHVEAGLRSFDRRMPEEINRVLTDHASDLLLAPTRTAVDNLRHEGINPSRIRFVGDVMYDALLAFKDLFLREREGLLRQAGLHEGSYFLATIHRAENTDDGETLRGLIEALKRISVQIAPVLWPVHPRTQKRMRELGTVPSGTLTLLEPLGYLQIQAYLTGARGLLTDSGGLQKEAALQGIPTVTLRDKTEWPETVEAGLNTVVGTQRDRIVAAAARCDGPRPGDNALHRSRAFGSGNAAELIGEALNSWGHAYGPIFPLRT